jgi:hypothetical protein
MSFICGGGAPFAGFPNKIFFFLGLYIEMKSKARKNKGRKEENG